MSKPWLTTGEVGAMRLIELRTEVLTDGAANCLCNGGNETTDAPILLPGQGHDITEDQGWLIAGHAVVVLGIILGALSVRVWS